ncbi:(2Fe-2S)-binding protein [Pseudonocardia xinjiangensis]|uniref:(2Fe-2S)-binding protein n=1 Tax=Pseudonocardia xinjiangensis TaxID=75289 RepID=UPI003D913696
MTTARAVLADVAALGPFFTVATEPAEGVDPSWRPFVDLYTDPGPLHERIAYVRRALTPTDASDQVDAAVAASIAFQGLAALLVSAPFGAAVLHGELPELTPQALHWRPSAGGPWPLWCSAPETVPVPGPDEAAVALAALFAQHLEPLVAAVRAQVRISERVLWGSVASSVAGAKRLVGMQRPQAAERAAEVARRLLAAGRLAGTGELLPPVGPDRYWSFRRRSCCLYYRVPGGGLCEDCVLHARRR